MLNMVFNFNHSAPGDRSRSVMNIMTGIVLLAMLITIIVGAVVLSEFGYTLACLPGTQACTRTTYSIRGNLKHQESFILNDVKDVNFRRVSTTSRGRTHSQITYYIQTNIKEITITKSEFEAFLYYLNSDARNAFYHKTNNFWGLLIIAILFAIALIGLIIIIYKRRAAVKSL